MYVDMYVAEDMPVCRGSLEHFSQVLVAKALDSARTLPQLKRNMQKNGVVGSERYQNRDDRGEEDR